MVESSPVTANAVLINLSAARRERNDDVLLDGGGNRSRGVVASASVAKWGGGCICYYANLSILSVGRSRFPSKKRVIKIRRNIEHSHIII